LVEQYVVEKAQRITARAIAKKERSNAVRRGDKWRCHTLRKRYGITAAQYDEMLAQQGGACFICREVKDRRLEVDHCHTTGRVRRLLCSRCNTIVGVLENDRDRLTGAEAYIASFAYEIRGVGQDDRPKS
jgi:hypothetical protein